MAIILSGNLSRKGDKTWYTFEWGKGQGQRRASGIFTYTKPKDQIQKQHNADAKKLLEVKLSEFTLDFQSSNFEHEFKKSFQCKSCVVQEI